MFQVPESEIFDLVVTLITLAMNLSIVFVVTNAYRKYRYPSLLFLQLGSVLFLITILLPEFAIFLPNTVRGLIVLDVFGIILMACSFYLLVLFFESFWSEFVLNRTTILLGVYIAIMSGILLGTAFTVTLLDENVETGIILILTEPLSESESALGSWYSNLSWIGGLGIFLSFFVAIGQLVRKYQSTRDEEIRKVVAWMLMGLAIMIISALIVSQNLAIGSMPFLVGYGLIFYVYLRQGVLSFRGEALERLLVLDETGLPQYSYRFSSTNEVGSNDEDVLFSGALQAISSLLGELTGTRQQVREITLEGVILVVQRVGQRTIILVTQQSTKIYREALARFSSLVNEVVGEIPPHQTFSDAQSATTDTLIRESFGVE